MLPVDARREQEPPAIEVGADAGLDAVDEIHQHEALARLGGTRFEQRGDVAAVRLLSGEALAGRCAELEHRAPRPRAQVGQRGLRIGELARRRGGKADTGQQVLRVAAVVLQSITERAAADDVIPGAPQLVLQGAEADRLEEDNPVVVRLAHPGEFVAPVLRARHHAGHRARRERFADGDAHLVAFGHQPQVERSQIAGFGDAEDAHRRRLVRLGPLHH